jgi:hypothetical protein
MGLTKKQALAFKIFAEKMDSRDRFLSQLLCFKQKHGYVPTKYKLEYRAFEKDGFKSWRQIPKVYKRVGKAANKAAKAKGLEQLRKEAMALGLKDLNRSLPARQEP